jgi:hypothetical protein
VRRFISASSPPAAGSPPPPPSFRLPRVVFGGSLVRSVRRSAPRAARPGLAACPSRAISLGRWRSFACRGGYAAALPFWSLRARYASFLPLLSPGRLALACRLGVPLHSGILVITTAPNGGIELGNSFLDDCDS